MLGKLNIRFSDRYCTFASVRGCGSTITCCERYQTQNQIVVRTVGRPGESRRKSLTPSDPSTDAVSNLKTMKKFPHGARVRFLSRCLAAWDRPSAEGSTTVPLADSL